MGNVFWPIGLRMGEKMKQSYRIQFTLFMGLLSLALSGCATGVKRGIVAMKISDTEAHVGIGASEVKVGDHVELYSNVCTGGGGKRSDGAEPRKCTKEARGHGKVKEILSRDYSVVEFPSGTTFSEGDTIEQHAH